MIRCKRRPPRSRKRPQPTWRLPPMLTPRWRQPRHCPTRRHWIPPRPGRRASVAVPACVGVGLRPARGPPRLRPTRKPRFKLRFEPALRPTPRRTPVTRRQLPRRQLMQRQADLQRACMSRAEEPGETVSIQTASVRFPVPVRPVSNQTKPSVHDDVFNAQCAACTICPSPPCTKTARPMLSGLLSAGNSIVRRTSLSACNGAGRAQCRTTRS